ncbi:sugar ABC transporter permease [Corynebacterium bovis]|uniref:carbohydrate ABC transporter permease n=1 Tax=Corynebacterium bovis TaxID=36808 RepID=UPI003139E7E8
MTDSGSPNRGHPGTVTPVPTGAATPVAAAGRSTRRAGRWNGRESLLAVVLLAPNLILLGVFTYRPLLDNIRLSFFDWNISSPTSTFIGVKNYVEWFTRPDTPRIVGNTVFFTVFAVAGSMILGLVLALLLDQRLPGRNLVRGVIFAPFVISGAAVGISLQFVFDPHFGMVNDLLRRLGVEGPDWYGDPAWALVMVTFAFVWKNLGYAFVIYLAAVQGLSRDLVEAAQIDGAGRWTAFRRVTLPQLRPTTFFLMITILLNSVQVFDIINVMTAGGPRGDGTTTLVFQVYRESFVNFRAGYGAAVATVLFVVLLVVTVIQVRVMDRRTAQ